MNAVQSPGNQKLLQYLDQHILDDDQPTTCPHCGRRTEDDHFSANKQVCHCLGCHYTFMGVFE